jgi:hypothetical protein
MSTYILSGMIFTESKSQVEYALDDFPDVALTEPENDPEPPRRDSSTTKSSIQVMGSMRPMVTDSSSSESGSDDDDDREKQTLGLDCSVAEGASSSEVTKLPELADLLAMAREAEELARKRGIATSRDSAEKSSAPQVEGDTVALSSSPPTTAVLSPLTETRAQQRERIKAMSKEERDRYYEEKRVGEEHGMLLQCAERLERQTRVSGPSPPTAPPGKGPVKGIPHVDLLSPLAHQNCTVPKQPPAAGSGSGSPASWLDQDEVRKVEFEGALMSVLAQYQ